MLIEYDTPYVVKTYYLLGYVLGKGIAHHDGWAFLFTLQLENLNE